MATQESPVFRGTNNLRFYGFILSIIAMIVITILLVQILLKLKREESAFGGTAKQNFTILFIGSYIYPLSAIVIRGSMFFTKGKWALFGAEKNIFFVLGYLLFIIGIVRVSLAIIDFHQTPKIVIRIVYFVYVLLGITVIGLQSLNIFDINPIEQQTLTLQTYAAFLSVILIIFFIFALYREHNFYPSKVEKLRLKLLSLSLITPIIELLIIGYFIALKDAAASNYGIVFFIAVPASYIVFHPIMYLLISWSLFTPNWLLIRANIIQPSFSKLLEKDEN